MAKNDKEELKPLSVKCSLVLCSLLKIGRRELEEIVNLPSP
jgi:hypothetical protein